MNDILVFGTIGKDVKAVDVAKRLSRIQSDIVNVQIHSPGGSVDEGYTIYNLLKNSGKEIHTTIIGQCASIATIVALAGSKRKMTRDSKWMIHNPWTSLGGDAQTLENNAKALRELENKMADFYSSHTGIPAFLLKEMMNQESEMNADKALEMGFITEILEPVMALAFVDEGKEEVIKENFISKMESKIDKILAYLTPKKKENPIQAWELSLDSGLTLISNNPQNANNPTIGDEVKIKENAEALEDGEQVIASTNQILIIKNGKIEDIQTKVGEIEAKDEKPDFMASIEAVAKVSGERFDDTEKLISGLSEKFANIEALITKSQEAVRTENESLRAELKELKSHISSGYTPPASGEIGGYAKGKAIYSETEKEIQKIKERSNK